jgi:hypothetical protein
MEFNRIKTDLSTEDIEKTLNGFPLPAFAGTSFVGMSHPQAALEAALFYAKHKEHSN